MTSLIIQQLYSFFHLFTDVVLNTTFPTEKDFRVSLIFKQFIRIILKKNFYKISNFYELESIGILFCLILGFTSGVPFSDFAQVHEQISIQFPLLTNIKSPELSMKYPSILEYESSLPKLFQHFFSLLFSYPIHIIRNSFNLITSILVPRIKEGSLESHRFLFLFLYHIYDSKSDVPISETALIQILFPSTLFQSHSSHFVNLAILRKLSFDCFFSFFPSISQETFMVYFLPLFTRLLSDEKLFSEVLNIISNHIQFQINKEKHESIIEIINTSIQLHEKLSSKTKIVFLSKPRYELEINSQGLLDKSTIELADFFKSEFNISENVHLRVYSENRSFISLPEELQPFKVYPKLSYFLHGSTNLYFGIKIQKRVNPLSQLFVRIFINPDNEYMIIPYFYKYYQPFSIDDMKYSISNLFCTFPDMMIFYERNGDQIQNISEDLFLDEKIYITITLKQNILDQLFSRLGKVQKFIINEERIQDDLRILTQHVLPFLANQKTFKQINFNEIVQVCLIQSNLFFTSNQQISEQNFKAWNWF